MIVTFSYLLFFLGVSIDKEPVSVSLTDLRENYIQAIDDARLAQQQLEYLSTLPDKDPLLLAYEGAFEALMAKHVWNPYKKFAHLKQFQILLQEAINKSPNSIEIRFLRYSVQYHLPRFLGYSKELEEDQTVMLSLLASDKTKVQEPKVLKTIVNFLSESNRLNEKEKEFISMLQL